MAVYKIRNLAVERDEVFIDDPAAKKKADKAADLIGEAFDWAATAEGEDFWEDVYSRLNQIARDGQLA